MISFTNNPVKSINKLSNKLRREIDMLPSRKEFSGSQGRTLHFLLAQTEDIFQKDIEEEFGIRPSTATELLKQMENSGLLYREAVSYDNRLKRIVLTEKALTFKTQVINDLENMENKVLQGISDEEISHFLSVIEKMSNNLSK